MPKISKILSREILDSKSNPTLEVDVYLDDGTAGRASVPSGASKGTNEAHELRDGDETRYHGKGVKNAVANVNGIINDTLKGREPEQKTIDKLLNELDGTKTKEKLGANAILGTSLSVCKAMAISSRLPLYQYISQIAGYGVRKKGDLFPTPFLVLLNGAKHAYNNLDFQEYCIIPDVKPFKEQIRVSVEIYQSLTKFLIEKAYSLSLGDEGGYGPNLPSNEDGIKIILEAIVNASYIPERDIYIGLDIAASSFWQKPKYVFVNEKKSFSSDDLIEYYRKLIKSYPIKLMEDPFSEDDYSGWEKMTIDFGKKMLLVGDDIFVTNPTLLQQSIDRKIANACIIKPNQIGTLSETLQTVGLAKKAGYKIIVSHRSGETTDAFISDLAFAVSAHYIKAGAPERGERVAKYNRLLEIEEELTKIYPVT